MHSYSSMMDKISRMAYLKGEKKRLNNLAYQYGLYLQSKGGFITAEELTKAMHLIEMINSVQAEGERMNAEFSNEWRNEWRKEVAKAIMNICRS